MDNDANHILLRQPVSAVQGGVCGTGSDVDRGGVCGVRGARLLLEGEQEEGEEGREKSGVEVLEEMGTVVRGIGLAWLVLIE